jgi:hypothetical protein
MTNKTRAILASAVLSIFTAEAVDRVQAAPFSPNDLVVFQQATTGNAGVNIQMLELTTAIGQSSPVQTLTDSALYTDSSGSEGDLTTVAGTGGSVLAFTGFTSSGTTETSVAGRGAGLVDVNGFFSQPTTYSNSTTSTQTRGAYSGDLANWYMADKTGIFYNGGSAPLSGSVNTRSIKNFGGTTYFLQTGTTGGTTVVETITPSSPSPGITSITSGALSGLPTDGNAVDFTMLSSGSNGSTFDTLYYTSSVGIVKYALIAGTWTSEGSDPSSATGIGTKLSNITAKPDPVSGVDLYFTNDATAGATLEEVTDSAAYNATISPSAAATLYSAGTTAELRGVAFAPTGVPEPGSLSLLALSGGILLRRKRPRAR